jgi:protein gp37
MSIPRSTIGWTDYSGGDANFVLRGKAPGECEVSAGCANCYAYALRNRDPKRAADVTTWDAGKLARLARVRLGGEGLRRGPGARPMCFVVDMGDLFHPRVPEDFIMQALGIMGDRADVDWQVLTKRPERMAALWGDVRPWPGNVWAGVTAETQAMAAARIPHLARVPAPVRFVSVEPMLEPVILDLGGLAWVICGGESGPGRRPFDVAWARGLGDRCDAAGVPFFYKQGSARYPGRDCILDGAERKAWPTTAPQAQAVPMF